MLRLRVLLATVAIAVLTSTTVLAASWAIVENPQKVCVRQAILPNASVYYAVWVKGTWSRPLKFGVDGAPSGSLVWMTSDPIPAGSSEGVYSLGSVGIQLPTATAAGTYNVSLWASDGTTKSAYPVSFVVAASSCRKY